MNGRNTAIAVWLSALLVIGASGAVIVTYWPTHGWALAFAHAPATMKAYLIYWLTLPFNAVSLLLVWLAVAVFWSKAAPSQKRWAYGTLIVASAANLFFEALRVGGLFVYRAQRAQYVAAGGDLHKFRFDTDFLILRITMAVGALFIIWFANRMPKLLGRLPVRPGREDWARVAPRLGGWLLVATGVGQFVCAFVQPFQSAMMIYAAMLGGILLIWLSAAGAYRFVGPPAGTASRS